MKCARLAEEGRPGVQVSATNREVVLAISDGCICLEVEVDIEIAEGLAAELLESVSHIRRARTS